MRLNKGHRIFILVYCLFAFSSLVFHLGVALNILLSRSCYSIRFLGLLIRIKIGFVYFLRENIFVSLLVRFSLSAHSDGNSVSEFEGDDSRLSLMLLIF